MTKHINILTTGTIAKATDGDSNIYEVIGAVVGSRCFDSEGNPYFFTEAALKAHSSSWSDGIITLNHVQQDAGTIVSAQYDDSTKGVRFKILLGNEDTAKRVDNKEPTGVSIEAMITDVGEGNTIQAFEGTGIAVVFYPDQPACPLSEGCGILSKASYSRSLKAHKIEASLLDGSLELDLARVNADGDVIKVKDIVFWSDNLDITTNPLPRQLESDILFYLAEMGQGTYHFYPTSDVRVGEKIPEGVQSIYTTSISVGADTTGTGKSVGGKEIMPSEDPELETVPKKDYQEMVAKVAELTQENTALKVDKVSEDSKIELKAKDDTIATLQSELDQRDTAAVASLVVEINKLDPDFVVEDSSPEQIKTIHASLVRVAAKDTPKADEDIIEGTGAEFKAPLGEGFADDQLGQTMTIGGIVSGRWMGGTRPIVSAKVPMKKEES